MKKELEFAYQWVPEQVDRGHTTKSACGVLLMKVYMSLGEFDNAIKVGNEIVAKHPLMVNRFTSTKNNHPNLMFDLHSVEAKSDPAIQKVYYMVYPNRIMPVVQALQKQKSWLTVFLCGIIT